MIFKLVDALVSQPLHLILLSVLVSVLTGLSKCSLKFIKRVEITYFLPYVLGILSTFIYSAIMKVNIPENYGQIAINGVYVALLSSILFQLYKAVKDIGLKSILQNEKTYKIYQELKNKLKSNLDAVTYAKKIGKVDKEDIDQMIDILRGSGIDDINLYSVANDLSVVSKAFTKEKKYEIKEKISGTPEIGGVNGTECS